MASVVSAKRLLAMGRIVRVAFERLGGRRHYVSEWLARTYRGGRFRRLAIGAGEGCGRRGLRAEQSGCGCLMPLAPCLPVSTSQQEDVVAAGLPAAPFVAAGPQPRLFAANQPIALASITR